MQINCVKHHACMGRPKRLVIQVKNRREAPILNSFVGGAAQSDAVSALTQKGKWPIRFWQRFSF